MYSHIEQTITESLEDPESDPLFSPQSSPWAFHWLEETEIELAASQFESTSIPPAPPPKGRVWKTKIRFREGFKAPDLKELPWKHVVIRSRPRWRNPPPQADSRLPFHYTQQAEEERERRPMLTERDRTDFQEVVDQLVAQGFEKTAVGTYKKLLGKQLTVIRTLNHTTNAGSFWVEKTVYPQP